MKKLVFAVLWCTILATPAFSTNLVEDTAIRALREAKHSETGKTVEHGGMIVKRDGGEWGSLYEYIEPTAGGKVDGVQVLRREFLQPGDVLVATYHVHLCLEGYYHDLFSTQDIMLALLSDVPEFMLDECTGEVHEFNPATDKVHDTGREVHLFGFNCEEVVRHLPVGQIVGNIGETETLQVVPEEQQTECKKKK